MHFRGLFIKLIFHQDILYKSFESLSYYGFVILSFVIAFTVLYSLYVDALYDV